eukprot:gene31219-6369_t
MAHMSITKSRASSTKAHVSSTETRSDVGVQLGAMVDALLCILSVHPCGEPSSKHLTSWCAAAALLSHPFLWSAIDPTAAGPGQALAPAGQGKGAGQAPGQALAPAAMSDRGHAEPQEGCLDASRSEDSRGDPTRMDRDATSAASCAANLVRTQILSSLASLFSSPDVNHSSAWEAHAVRLLAAVVLLPFCAQDLGSQYKGFATTASAAMLREWPTVVEGGLCLLTRWHLVETSDASLAWQLRRFLLAAAEPAMLARLQRHLVSELCGVGASPQGGSFMWSRCVSSARARCVPHLAHSNQTNVRARVCDLLADNLLSSTFWQQAPAWGSSLRAHASSADPLGGLALSLGVADGVDVDLMGSYGSTVVSLPRTNTNTNNTNTNNTNPYGSTGVSLPTVPDVSGRPTASGLVQQGVSTTPGLTIHGSAASYGSHKKEGQGQQGCHSKEGSQGLQGGHSQQDSQGQHWRLSQQGLPPLSEQERKLLASLEQSPLYGGCSVCGETSEAGSGADGTECGHAPASSEWGATRTPCLCILSALKDAPTQVHVDMLRILAMSMGLKAGSDSDCDVYGGRGGGRGGPAEDPSGLGFQPSPPQPYDGVRESTRVLHEACTELVATLLKTLRYLDKAPPPPLLLGKAPPPPALCDRRLLGEQAAALLALCPSIITLMVTLCMRYTASPVAARLSGLPCAGRLREVLSAFVSWVVGKATRRKVEDSLRGEDAVRTAPVETTKREIDASLRGEDAVRTAPVEITKREIDASLRGGAAVRTAPVEASRRKMDAPLEEGVPSTYSGKAAAAVHLNLNATVNGATAGHAAKAVLASNLNLNAAVNGATVGHAGEAVLASNLNLNTAVNGATVGHAGEAVLAAHPTLQDGFSAGMTLEHAQHRGQADWAKAELCQYSQLARQLLDETACLSATLLSYIFGQLGYLSGLPFLGRDPSLPPPTQHEEAQDMRSYTGPAGRVAEFSYMDVDVEEDFMDIRFRLSMDDSSCPAHAALVIAACPELGQRLQEQYFLEIQDQKKRRPAVDSLDAAPTSPPETKLTTELELMTLPLSKRVDPTAFRYVLDYLYFGACQLPADELAQAAGERDDVIKVAKALKLGTLVALGRCVLPGPGATLPFGLDIDLAWLLPNLTLALEEQQCPHPAAGGEQPEYGGTQALERKEGPHPGDDIAEEAEQLENTGMQALVDPECPHSHPHPHPHPTAGVEQPEYGGTQALEEPECPHPHPTTSAEQSEDADTQALEEPECPHPHPTTSAEQPEDADTQALVDPEFLHPHPTTRAEQPENTGTQDLEDDAGDVECTLEEEGTSGSLLSAEEFESGMVYCPGASGWVAPGLLDASLDDELSNPDSGAVSCPGARGWVVHKWVHGDEGSEGTEGTKARKSRAMGSSRAKPAEVASHEHPPRATPGKVSADRSSATSSSAQANTRKNSQANVAHANASTSTPNTTDRPSNTGSSAHANTRKNSQANVAHANASTSTPNTADLPSNTGSSSHTNTRKNSHANTSTSNSNTAYEDKNLEAGDEAVNPAHPSLLHDLALMSEWHELVALHLPSHVRLSHIEGLGQGESGGGLGHGASGGGLGLGASGGGLGRGVSGGGLGRGGSEAACSVAPFLPPFFDVLIAAPILRYGGGLGQGGYQDAEGWGAALDGDLALGCETEGEIGIEKRSEKKGGGKSVGKSETVTRMYDISNNNSIQGPELVFSSSNCNKVVESGTTCDTLSGTAPTPAWPAYPDSDKALPSGLVPDSEKALQSGLVPAHRVIAAYRGEVVSLPECDVEVVHLLLVYLYVGTLSLGMPCADGRRLTASLAAIPHRVEVPARFVDSAARVDGHASACVDQLRPTSSDSVACGAAATGLDRREAIAPTPTTSMPGYVDPPTTSAPPAASTPTNAPMPATSIPGYAVPPTTSAPPAASTPTFAPMPATSTPAIAPTPTTSAPEASQAGQSAEAVPPQAASRRCSACRAVRAGFRLIRCCEALLMEGLKEQCRQLALQRGMAHRKRDALSGTQEGSAPNSSSSAGPPTWIKQHASDLQRHVVTLLCAE